ncbi:MAG: Ig-like domain-containing protein, partial [Candidatus Thermoplasmatota archaeon]
SAYDLFSGLWQMQFSNDGTIWSDWIDWSSTTSWNLNSEDGEKKVYFRVRDRAGNQAPAIYDTIILDASLPSTTHSLAGTLGSNGWYVSDVTAALSSSDEISGIDYTKYRINAGNWITYSSPFTISQEGSNTVEFFACDLAGNIESTKSITVRIDKTAPATTNSISGTIGSNGWYISDVTIALSASDALSDVDYTKYRITTGEWFTYSAPFTVSSEGTTHIEFYSADLAGNVESTKSITFKIDKTAPTTTYSLSGSSGNNNWYVSDITLSLSTSDALSGVNKTYYKIETGAGQEGTSLTLTQEGMHTIYYYSTDNASNQEVEKNITVKIDKTAPTTTHSLSGTVGNNNWYVSDVSITLLPSDATSGVTQVYYKINNENIQTGTSIKLTQSGIYTVKYWSADVAGNSEQDQSVTIKIDKGKPIVTLTSPANNEVVVTNTLTLSWSGSDDASGVSYYELQVDNNNDFASPEFSTITTSASATTSLLLDAIYYWRVRAIDNAGNPGDWQTRTFTINTGPPTDLIITINDGAQFTNSTSVTLTLSASSNAYEMCFSNDNSTWSLRETFASTKAWTLAGGDDGIRIVYFKCRSVSGNESKAACDTIILDTTAPTLEISKPQNGTITNKEKIMIEGSVRDLNGIETAEILVNDAIYQLTLESGNFTYLGSLSNGTNIITLRAKDVAQNQAEISIVIIYDPAIPAITIHTPANNSITNNSQCLITGRTDLNCKVIINNLTAEINDTGYFNATIVLAEGLNVISIISINSASTEARITLCVLLDTIPPAPPANLSAEPSEWSNRNIFAVKWREANDATGIKCAWYKLGAPPTGDGDGKLTESRNITIQVSEEGIYTVYVWLEDNAGNANFKNFSTILIKYDYSAPLNKHIINGVLGGEQWYISNVTVTLAPVDNLSGVRSVKYRINNGSWDSYNDKIILSEGVWAVEYYAQDNAGNTQNSKFYIKIDLTPPENVIFQNIPRYINITNVTLSWSKSEDTLSGLKGYRIECNNNLTDWLNTTNYNLNLLEGIYSIRIIVSDLAGNVRYSDFITTICDLTSPVTNILLTSNCTKIPSEDLFGSEVKVEFYFEKDTSGIKETKYKINNTEWHTYNSSFSLEKDGEYTISYYSIDFAGNLEKTKTKHVTIDRKLFPPAVKILFPLDNAEISQNITCSYNASSPLNETLKVKALLFNPTRKALLLENGTNTGSFLLVPSAFLNGNYILEIVVTDSACRYSSDKINISIKNRLIVGLEVDRVEALTRKLPVSVTIRNYYGTGCFYIELYTNGRRADSNFASLQEFELTTLKLFCTVEEASDYELSVKLFTNDRELIEERKIQLKVLSSEDGAKDCAKPLFNLLYLYAIIFVLITICVPSAYLSVRAKKRTQHPIKVNSLEEVTQELEYYKNKLERR